MRARGAEDRGWADAPTEREPRTAIFLFFRMSLAMAKSDAGGGSEWRRRGEGGEGEGGEMDGRGTRGGFMKRGTPDGCRFARE